jgi:hypothetical protein
MKTELLKALRELANLKIDYSTNKHTYILYKYTYSRDCHMYGRDADVEQYSDYKEFDKARRICRCDCILRFVQLLRNAISTLMDAEIPEYMEYSELAIMWYIKKAKERDSIN